MEYISAHGVTWVKDPEFDPGEQKTRQWKLPFEKIGNEEDLARLKVSAMKWRKRKLLSEIDKWQDEQNRKNAAQLASGRIIGRV